MIFFLFLFGKRIFSKIWKIWKMSLEIISKDDCEINMVTLSQKSKTKLYTYSDNVIHDIYHTNTNDEIDILDEEYSII
jgi:hypothetical protein